jgi:hypothetical protein
MLKDDQTLAECNIQHNATIHLAMRPAQEQQERDERELAAANQTEPARNEIPEVEQCSVARIEKPEIQDNEGMIHNGVTLHSCYCWF